MHGTSHIFHCIMCSSSNLYCNAGQWLQKSH